jgi:RNA polymerase sigma-70 factor, ECF subfamily
MVFETIAYTVPPLRLGKKRVYRNMGCPSNPFVVPSPVRLMTFLRLRGLKSLFGNWLAWQPLGPILRVVSSGDVWGSQATRPTPPRRPEYDEQALIAAAQQGNLPAFNKIILHYQGLAYNVAYRIMGDGDSASDTTQDAFVKAYQRISQYRGGSFKAWLLRIVTNTCYDALRARKRRPTVSLENEVEGEESDPDYDPRLIDTGERPDAFVMRKELAGVIQTAISQLPADQRTALILSDVEGMDYQEIADAMGTALGTVKSRLSRARAKMRDLLLAHAELLPAQYRHSDG